MKRLLKGAGAAIFLLAGQPGMAETPPPPAPPLGSMLELPPEPGFALQSAVCSDGSLVEYRINEAAGIARGLREGRIYTLLKEVGKEPPHYVNEENTVVVEPERLLISRTDGAHLACARLPAEPMAGILSGVIMKRDRMLLPQGTAVVVTLEDADGEALATSEMRTRGNQIPLHFLLRYQPAETSADETYQLTARLKDSRGQLLYETAAPRAVLHGMRAEPPLVLEVRQAAPAAPHEKESGEKR